MATPEIQQLNFALDVVDDWPPVASECLPAEPVVEGYRILKPPLFVKELSVGDVVTCKVDEESGCVFDWQHASRSGNSTFTFLHLGDEAALQDGLAKLRELGCSTVTADALGVTALDVPASVCIDAVDDVLDDLEDHEVPIACPSMRHPE